MRTGRDRKARPAAGQLDLLSAPPAPPVLEREGASTGIEWTEDTVNIWAGCSKVSPGCKNCYAIVSAAHVERCGTAPHYEGLTTRLENGQLDWAVDATGHAVLGYNPNAIRKILSARPGRLLFLNSMSDFWHPDAKDEWRRAALDAISSRPDVCVQVLTKRPELVAPILKRMGAKLPDNFWLGVTIESRTFAAARLRLIRQVDAFIRFLSVEPLLDDVVGRGLDLSGIHWVIAGGESGEGARPMKPLWAQRLRDHCEQHKVPFFFKQWGQWRNNPIGSTYSEVRERDPNGKGGSLLDGRSHREFPARFWERWGKFRQQAVSLAPGGRLPLVEEQ